MTKKYVILNKKTYPIRDIFTFQYEGIPYYGICPAKEELPEFLKLPEGKIVKTESYFDLVTVIETKDINITDKNIPEVWRLPKKVRYTNKVK